jgi:vacuolar-type H+-ATPase subunit H
MQSTAENPKPAGDPLASARDDAHAVLSDLSAHGTAAAQDVRETVVQVTDKVQSHGNEILEAAKEHADALATETKEAGSEQISGFAAAIRNAAKDLEGTSPEIAGHVRTAAGSIEELSTALRERSVGQLFQDVTLLARRQPTAFFGVAAIAGFAIARFAKSSGDHASVSSRAPQRAPGANAAPGWVQPASGSAPRPATMAGATLGGAAAHRPGDAAPGTMPTPASEHPNFQRDVASENTGSVSHSDPIPNERSGSQL